MRPTPGGGSEVSQGVTVDARLRIVNRHKALTGTSCRVQISATKLTQLPEDAKQAAEGTAAIAARDPATADQIPWQLFAFVAGGFVVVTLVSLGFLMILMRYLD